MHAPLKANIFSLRQPRHQLQEMLSVQCIYCENVCIQNALNANEKEHSARVRVHDMKAG